MDTLFKFTAEQIGIEWEGSEEFVRRELEFFQPLLSPVGGGEGQAPEDPDSLSAWYGANVPPGQSPTMQDHILVFAYHLNRVKRHFIFTPDDMKAAFREIGRNVPKSLLQIMGSLKRDHQLLYPGEKRGEYVLTPAGIKHVEKLLGLKREERPPEGKAASDAFPSPPPEKDHASAAARAKFESLIREKAEEEES